MGPSSIRFANRDRSPYIKSLLLLTIPRCARDISSYIIDAALPSCSDLIAIHRTPGLPVVPRDLRYITPAPYRDCILSAPGISSGVACPAGCYSISAEKTTHSKHMPFSPVIYNYYLSNRFCKAFFLFLIQKYLSIHIFRVRFLRITPMPGSVCPDLLIYTCTETPGRTHNCSSPQRHG